MQQSQPQVLYTPEQRAKRDATRWTLVQGVLAPVQFLVFLVSLYLVVNSLKTGENTEWALASVVLKTLVLYTIMITGCIWEKVVFDKYLFAHAFFWEDVVNDQLLLALTAYITYGINAAQYIRKLRMARLQKPYRNLIQPNAQVSA